MMYRKLEVRIDSLAEPLLRQISRGARLLLFEELEVFAGTEDKSLYRSEVVDEIRVYEIGVGGVLLASVFTDELGNVVCLADIELL